MRVDGLGEYLLLVTAALFFSACGCESGDPHSSAPEPRVTIDSGPGEITAETIAVFEVYCDLSDCWLECSLNDSDWETCESPVVYDDLADGEHLFLVRGLNADGLPGEAAEWVWTIDTSLPRIVDLEGPDELTNETTASFYFDCSVEGCTYECSFLANPYEACEPGVTYDDLEDGSYSFSVRAQDPLGKRSEPATWTWTVDTRNPLVLDLAGPPDPTNQTTASFDYRCSREGCVFTCELDGTVHEHCEPGDVYGSDEEEDRLPDGVHEFSVFATDELGNVGPEATWDWTVDTEEPEIEGLAGPSSPTNETEASLSFGCTKTGCEYTCSLEGDQQGVVSGETACEPGVTYSGLNDDEYTFTVYASDAAGNVGPAATWDWTVDTEEPEIEGLAGPSSPTNETEASLSFGCTKTGCEYTCSLEGEGQGVVSGETACEPGVTYSGLDDDEYTFTVYASDAAGNVGPAATWDWTVDTEEPIVVFTVTPPDETSETWALFEFECLDKTCVFNCALDYESGEGSTEIGSWEGCESPHLLTDLEVGSYLLRVRGTDAAGNEGDAEHGWTVVAPRIESISNRDTYDKDGGGWTGEGSGLSISEERGHLAVWNAYSMDVRVIDLHTEEQVGNYPMGGNGSGKGLDYSPDGANLFGVNNNGDYLFRANTTDYSVDVSVSPPGASGCDVRVISDDRLIVGVSDRVLLYDYDLNLIDSAVTPYAGFLSFDYDESKIYASGVGYHADEGIARVSLDDDVLALDWQEVRESTGGIFPLHEHFLEVAESGTITIRQKSDGQEVETYQLNQARRTPAAQLSADSVVIVDTDSGEILEYRESSGSLTYLDTTPDGGTTNGIEVTPGFLAIYWNKSVNGLELWDVELE